MMYNLLYVSNASFWKNSCIKQYQHHDVLLKYINRKMPLQIHIALPMSGDSYFKDLLEKGTKSRIIPTWRDLPFKVYPELYRGDIDGMLVNGNSSTWDYVLPDGTEISKIEACDYLVDRAIYCKDHNLPVVLYDADGFIFNKLNLKTDERVNFSLRIYNELKDYEKFTLISPFEFGLSEKDVFMPFVIDKEAMSPIKDLEERHYFTKYVGHNYKRDNFVKYFKASSKYGKVQVVGSGWNPYKKEIPDIEWKFKFPLTSDKVYDYYSDSMFGLYGTALESAQAGHYTFRIREFFEGGVLIIPDNYDYLINSICTDNFRYTLADLETKNIFDIVNKDNYKQLVQEQREKLLEKFDAELYVDILIEKLTM